MLLCFVYRFLLIVFCIFYLYHQKLKKTNNTNECRHLGKSINTNNRNRLPVLILVLLLSLNNPLHIVTVVEPHLRLQLRQLAYLALLLNIQAIPQPSRVESLSDNFHFVIVILVDVPYSLECLAFAVHCQHFEHVQKLIAFFLQLYLGLQLIEVAHLGGVDEGHLLVVAEVGGGWRGLG